MRKAMAVVGVALIGTTACRSLPDLGDSAELTATDVMVLRAAIVAVVMPRLPNLGDQARLASVTSRTSIVPIWGERPTTFPPSPPASFTTEAVTPPPLEYVHAKLLSLDEQSLWELRNRRERPIPDLGVPGLSNVEGAAPRPWVVVKVSAPVYAARTAIVFAAFQCTTGSCGEGWLIRLMKTGDSWRVTAQTMLWIV